MGDVLRYKLEVYRQYFSDKLYGLGVAVEVDSPQSVRTRRIGANPEKSDLVNFRGLD